MRTRPILAIVAAGLLLSGCGGGGGGDATPPETLTITSTADLEGLVRSDGIVLTTPFGEPVVGDNVDGVSFRGFVSFDLSGVPPGSTVLSATLQLTQRTVFGTPYPAFGAVLVDQVVYGNVLDPGAYSRTFPVNQGFATLSSDATFGVRSVDATLPVAMSVAQLFTQAQFRLRFPLETNLDAEGDTAHFFNSETPTAANRPMLVVTYRP